MVNENLGDELYDKFNSILDDLQTLPVGSPLRWLFVWDTICDVVLELDEWDSILAPNTDLKTIWNTFWATPWGGLDIEGSDVVDWLVKENLILAVEETE
jgi:hypothetical protein